MPKTPAAWPAALCVLLLSCRGGPAPSDGPEPASEICRAGTLLRVTGDPSDGGAPTIRYRLRHAEGMTDLVVTPELLSEAGGAMTLVGAEVEVRGVREEGDPERIAVSSLSRVTEEGSPCT